MTVYYNDNDAFCCSWMRKLVDVGLIHKGVVDHRDIRQISENLNDFQHVHFFAGIGGWSYALRLANWPDDRSVWTGSCPCQPFSNAGKRKAHDDERHLWPAWFELIRKYHPKTIFGEQVSTAIKYGWLDLVFDDLESEGYTCRAIVLPAASVGAPHIRKRLWFVANADGGNTVTERLQRSGEQRLVSADGISCAIPLGDSKSAEFDGNGTIAGGQQGRFTDASGMGDSDDARPQGWGVDSREHASECLVGETSAWAGCEWIECADGKQRPIKPGIFPLAYGIPARVPRLRAIGNSIVPQVAAEIIKAVMDI
jgi:DNA (cytosine-5)-methyltransferase 1